MHWLPGVAFAVACSSKGHYFDEPAHRVIVAGSSGASGRSTGHGGTGGAISSGGSAGTLQPQGAAGGTGASSNHGGSGGGTAAAGGENGGEPDGASGKGGSGGAGGPASGGSAGTTPQGGSAGVAVGTGGTGGTGGTDAAGEAGAGGEACVAKTEVCDGVSNDCDDAIDEGDVCPAGCSAKTFGGHTYLLCLAQNQGDQRTYQEAAQYCINARDSLGLDFGLELAHVESQAENDFAKTWLMASDNADGAVWLGANDIDDEGRWVWGRGTNATEFFVGSDQGGGMPYMDAFNDFADGRPNGNRSNEDCGAFDADVAFSWNDLVCDDSRLGFLCEQR